MMHPAQIEQNKVIYKLLDLKSKWQGLAAQSITPQTSKATLRSCIHDLDQIINEFKKFSPGQTNPPQIPMRSRRERG